MKRHRHLALSSLAALLALAAALLWPSPPARAANEFQATDTPGRTVYVVLVNQAGQFMAGATAESETDAHWTTSGYCIAAAQQGTTSNYFASTPAGLPAGVYTVEAFEQAGASPATSDTLLGTAAFPWSGTAEVTAATLNTQGAANGTAISGVSTKLGTPSGASIDADIVANSPANVWGYGTRSLTSLGTTAPSWYVTPATLAQIQSLLPANFGTLSVDGNGRVTLVPGQSTVAAGGNVATVGGQAPPVNWAAMSITSGGALTVGTLPSPVPSGYGGSGSAPTAAQIVSLLMSTVIDPLGTGLTFQDAISDIWDFAGGPVGTVAYPAGQQVTSYMRADGTTTAYTTTSAINGSGKATNRTRTNGTRP